MNKYECAKIKFPSGKENWKKIEQNNGTIALNIFAFSYFLRKNICCLCFKK